VAVAPGEEEEVGTKGRQEQKLFLGGTRKETRVGMVHFQLLVTTGRGAVATEDPGGDLPPQESRKAHHALSVFLLGAFGNRRKHPGEGLLALVLSLGPCRPPYQVHFHT
jgi:hypothetical protein